MYNGRLVTYAQNREDIILSGFFDKGKKGFYVDVGANEPTHESVTKLFYDRGWHGINIEPIPQLYEKLVSERPRDINLQVGVGAKIGSATLHYYPHGDGLSTMSDKMASNYKAAPSEFTDQAEELKIKVVTLKSILEEYAKDGPVSFLKVDVEGLEYEVLAGNDWTVHRPEVICIEANHIEKDWRPLLESHDYVLVFFDGVNNYYADKHTGRAAKFDYVKTVIFSEQIINFRLLKDFKERDDAIVWLQSTNKLLKAEVDAAKAELKAAEAQVMSLQKELGEVTPLKRHIKRHIKYRLGSVDAKIVGKLAPQNNYKPESVEASFSNADIKILLKFAGRNDSTNFDKFNKTVRPHPLYPVYHKTKLGSIKTVRKVMHPKHRGAK